MWYIIHFVLAWYTYNNSIVRYIYMYIVSYILSSLRLLKLSLVINVYIKTFSMLTETITIAINAYMNYINGI